MLGVVIVNYKTIDETVSYITQELVAIRTPYKVVVVDVACENTDHARAIAERCGGQFLENGNTLPSCDKKVYVLPHSENLGYAKGNNLGAQILSKHFSLEFFLFTNNDLRFADSDVADRLMEEARQYENLGAIGPRVLDLDGNDQSPMKYRNIWRRIIIPYSLYPFLYLFFQRGLFSDLIKDAPFGVYYRLMGCFLIVRADVFMAVDGFDEGTFLYAEEMILSERMDSIGKKMYFNPAVGVIHAHRQVTGRSLSNLKAMQLRLQSELYFYKKYKGISRFEGICSWCAMFLYSKCYYPMLRAAKVWIERRDNAERSNSQ